MSTVRLEKLSKTYGKDTHVVKAIDLEIKDGEFLVLLGPSGCGKTTTMRMIAGLEDVTSGKVFLDDIDITELPPQQRGVGMVFQNYAIWPHMTVKENITFPLNLQKKPKNEIEKIVEKTANITNITEYLDRYPNQLSGGQKQRVAVARAIAYSPKVFLMDEPLSALDAKLRESMRTDLKEIQKELKATTVFVTHDQAEALSLADRIVVMKDGVIMQSGSPDEIYHDCNNKFIADFIGTPPTNFFTVSIIKEGENVFIKHNSFKIKASANLKTIEQYINKDVIAGIRPEHINVNSSNKHVTIKPIVIEPQGNFKVIVTRLDEQKIKIVVNTDEKLAIEDSIDLEFQLDRLMLFDTTNEERIR